MLNNNERKILFIEFCSDVDRELFEESYWSSTDGFPELVEKVECNGDCYEVLENYDINIKDIEVENVGYVDRKMFDFLNRRFGKELNCGLKSYYII